MCFDTPTVPKLLFKISFPMNPEADYFVYFSDVELKAE